MDKTLTISLHNESGQYILQLTGRLDTLGARKLDETIRQLPQQSPLLLVLDMEHVSFLSSAGIRILIKYYKQCRETQGDLTLIQVPRQAEGVLKMVGLEQLVLGPEKPGSNPVYESELQNQRFRCRQLHQETARLICREQPAGEPPLLHPYDLLIGRDRRQEEFIALGNTLIAGQITGSPDFLYTLGVHGLPTHQLQFETENNRTTGFSVFIASLFQLCEAECAGIVILTRSCGLTGITVQDGLPQFTARPDYTGYATVIAGLAHRKNDPVLSAYTRPLNTSGSLSGHFHAAVYPHPPRFGQETGLPEALQSFTGNTQPLKIFHLLDDNRPLTGNGENRISQGQAWVIKNK